MHTENFFKKRCVVGDKLISDYMYNMKAILK